MLFPLMLETGPVLLLLRVLGSDLALSAATQEAHAQGSDWARALMVCHDLVLRVFWMWFYEPWLSEI